MRPSRRPIRIICRNTPLSMAQAKAVAQVMKRLNPGIAVQLLDPIDTAHDLVRHIPVPMNNRYAVVRAVEQTILEDRADIAVHSARDLPTEPSAGLVLAAIPERGESRETLISQNQCRFDQLPQGALIGTGTPRRAIQIKTLRPDLMIRPIQGNTIQRVQAVTQHRQFDATLIAAAALQRCNMGQYVNALIDPETIIPAVGEATIAMQCRADDHVTIRRCMPLNHARTAATYTAELQISNRLESAGYAHNTAWVEIDETGQVRMIAAILLTETNTMIRDQIEGKFASIKRLCNTLAKQLIRTANAGQ